MEVRIKEELKRRTLRFLIPILFGIAIIQLLWIFFDKAILPDKWIIFSAIRVLWSLIVLIFIYLLRKNKINWKIVVYITVLITNIGSAYMSLFVPKELYSNFLVGFSVVYMLLAALIYITWLEYGILFFSAVLFLLAFNLLSGNTEFIKVMFSEGIGFIIIGLVGILFSYLKYKNLVSEIRANIEKDIANQRLREANKILRQQHEEILQQKEYVQELNDMLLQKNKILEEKNKDIMDSLQVALRIQNILLKRSLELADNLLNYFLIYFPRDIISGDFYWVHKKSNNIYVAVADCTGHGVPASLLTVLGINLLNSIIVENYNSPNEILDELKRRLVKIIAPLKEGMDITLLKINLEDNSVEWSGANIPLIVITKNKDTYSKYESNNKVKIIEFGEVNVIEIKPDKQPIGYTEGTSNFLLQNVYVNKNDLLVLFSDGYKDQFGGEDNRRLRAKNFKKLLANTYNKNNPVIQGKELEQFLNFWKGSNKQTDDITVMGIFV